MKTGIAIRLGLAAFAAGLLLCDPAAAAEGTPVERLIAYEKAISTGDPSGAAAFLGDTEVRSLAARNPAASASLTGKAEALRDLKELLGLPWDDGNVNQLNQSLAARVDAHKPLAFVGVGPEPEKVLSWLERFQPSYPASKAGAVRKAIRHWEVIFGTMTSTWRMSWGMANMRSGDGVSVTRASWARMVLRERNAVIEQIMKNDPGFMIYNDDRLAAAKDQVAVGIALQQIKDSGALSAGQLAQLSGKSFDDQLYLLGNMFDNSGIKVSPELKARIDSARSSLPQEVLTAGDRELLGKMLGGAVTREIKGTRAGDIALRAFPGGLKISVAPLDGGYSRYDAASGSVVLDSETMQQYMRIKGYTAASVTANPAQLSELAKYMSPVVVYEAAHKAQADWAAAKGIYLPRTQENEIEAMSLEGLYSAEKLQSDEAFRAVFSGSREFTSYASKRVQIATEYKSQRTKGFATTVRQRYFSGLPSLDAAAAQVLAAVGGELERRAGITEQQRADIDAYGLNLRETLEMSPDELCYSVGEIKSAVLAKIQSDLSSLGVYRNHFSYAERRGRKAMRSLESGRAVRPGAPPKPI